MLTWIRQHTLKQHVLQILPWLIAGILLIWVLRRVPLQESWQTLQRLTFIQIGSLVLLNFLILVTLNGRWWLILRGQGYRVPFFTLFGYRLAAFGLSYFTPGPQFGGEPLQVYLVEKEHNTPRPAAIAAMTLDKALELTLNFAFLLIGVVVILQSRLLGIGEHETAVSASSAQAVIPLFLLAIPLGFLFAVWFDWPPITKAMQLGERLPLWNKRPAWHVTYQRGHKAAHATETEAHQFCRQSPHMFLLALLISIISWLLMIAEFWLMVSFLGLQLSLLQLIIALTAARITFLLLLPGGIGVFEAGQAFAFGAMGLNPALGISASLLIRGRDVILGVTGLWWGSRRLGKTKK